MLISSEFVLNSCRKQACDLNFAQPINCKLHNNNGEKCNCSCSIGFIRLLVLVCVVLVVFVVLVLLVIRLLDD